MISRAANRIIRAFGRLTKPKINSYENVFELMKDRSSQLDFIEKENSRKLNTTKFTSPVKLVMDELGVTEDVGREVVGTVWRSIGYAPVSGRTYRISQKINGRIQLQDNPSEVQLPYSPTNPSLKLHYSITKPMPLIPEHKITKSTAYIFNLPASITEKQILLELGYQQVKSIQIKYCMLGLPAYAILQFSSESYLSERMLGNSLEILLDGQARRLWTGADEGRLALNRRQLVLKGLPKGETPARLLKRLSRYGRVMHLEVPTEVYREPSLQQIKQLYKNERTPIRLNYHRKNGTVESQYYPPLESPQFETSNSQTKEADYKRRLKYCENVDVYEGKEGELETKIKGFCVVTYSCQEELQNCYLQLRGYAKMDLLNGREEFQFDEKHREALLRHIDNSYIQKCLDNGPTKDYDNLQSEQSKLWFKSLYMASVYEDYKYNLYQNMPKLIAEEHEQIIDHVTYRQYLNELKQSVGRGNLNPVSPLAQNNLYGKSFDQLAEEELYGMKLKERATRERYEVNIDDYVREPDTVSKLKKEKKKREESEPVIEEDEFDQIEDTQFSQKDSEMKFRATDRDPEEDQRRQRIKEEKAKERAKQSKQRRKFSTMKVQDSRYRQKTLKQKVRSHMLYNRFIRDTINQYMGIFSTEHLQSQFNRKKPSFTNPQNLTFQDGTEIITEAQVKTVLEHTTGSAQTFYTDYVKQNQIAKSLNIDIEERVMRDFENNDSEAFFELADVGVVKGEFKGQGEDLGELVRKLNFQAEFGQEYRLVDGEDGNKTIVKIAKLESIFPVDVAKKLEGPAKAFEKSAEFDPKKVQILEKHLDAIWSGQPLPDELAETFGIDKNSFDSQKFSEQICMELGLRKKDLQKLINLKNYSPEQLAEDYQMQQKIQKAREKRSEKKASDYGKDPSNIIIKDKDGKAVVSKFRQV